MEWAKKTDKKRQGRESSCCRISPTGGDAVKHDMHWMTHMTKTKKPNTHIYVYIYIYMCVQKESGTILTVTYAVAGCGVPSCRRHCCHECIRH